MAGRVVSEDLASGAAQRIRLAAGAEDVGLAVMLADLIRQNLEQNPRREPDFRKLDASISIEVPDVEVTVTLEFSRGSLIVHDGLRDSSQLRIQAGARNLLALPLVRISAGLPNLLSPDSRILRNGLLSGQVKIRGMFRHPLRLVRFTRLISVNG
jgi:hypothetical protein